MTVFVRSRQPGTFRAAFRLRRQEANTVVVASFAASTRKRCGVEPKDRQTRADLLLDAVPYKVHTVLTDNGTHFTNPAGDAWSPAEIRDMIANRKPFLAHAFEYAWRPERHRSSADKAQASLDD